MAKDATEIDALKAQLAAMQEQMAALAQPKADPGLEAVKLLAERSAPKEDPNYIERGPFTRADGSKPRLTRPTFFLGARQRDDQLTPDEVEAFNAITASRTARDGRWVADVRQNGSTSELWIEVPAKTQDDRQDLPALLMILLELQGGPRATDPLALAQRVAELEARLAAA